MLEFIESKFNICKTFIWFVSSKNKNLYSLHYIFKQHLHSTYSKLMHTVTQKFNKLATKINSH